MSQIVADPGADSPGIRPSEICENLDDGQAACLLPTGAFKLITALDPERINGSKRAKNLGKILSLELAVDDLQRRTILLDAVPATKIGELEDRIGLTIDQLRQKDELAPPLRRALLGFFGLAMIADRLTISSDPLKTVTPERGLFPHQKRAASAIEQYLYFEEGRAMLHLPTGVGKTRTAMSIIASHLRTRSKGVVLWLAATRELLEQAAAEFESTWKSVGIGKSIAYVYWSSQNPPINQVTDGIVIAGIGQAAFLTEKNESGYGILGDRTTMVVFDEAHQAVATTYQDIVETVVTRNPRTPLLGLSATPGRTWGNPEVDEAVAGLFYENKVMIDFGDANPIKRLTDEGLSRQC